MAEYYRIYTKSEWMGASGNALLAFTNKSGSGKKITISNVEIQNNTRMNRTATADTYLPPPVRFRCCKLVNIYGGEEIVPIKFDTNSPDIPSGITFYRTAGVELSYVNARGSTTYTQAAATANSTTFTPDSAPSWIASEHRDAERYFIVSSGANARRYEIIANTTTALTIDPPLSTTTSTTGILADVEEILHDGFLKGLNVSGSILPNLNYGVLNSKDASTGQLYDRSPNSNLQTITVKPTERLGFIVDQVHANLPMFVDCTIKIGSDTYQFSFFARLNSGENATFCIDNQSVGSDIEIQNFSLSEVGNQDTPYFQMVPISSINAASFSDTSKKLNVIKFDTNNIDLNSNICEVFTNVPVLPFGVPVSYIAEGASSATPRGFNYLNTKDFIGPVYMTFFPESVNHKTDNATYWTSRVPGTFGTQLSQPGSKFLGTPRSIIVREGEGFAIVSGAETATGAISVGISGWGSYDFAFDLIIENTLTPTITLTGLKVGSEVRAYTGTDPETSTLIDGTESSGTSFSFIHDNTGQDGYIMIFALGYQPIKLDISYTASVLEIPIQQTIDRNYENL